MKLQFRFQTPHSAPALTEGDLSPVALVESVERLFASPHYRAPMLPVVALRVLELARSPDVKFSAIVSVIEGDPLFAAGVLKLASSPIYAGRSHIRSIDQALLRLGLQTLSDLCLEAALSGRVFRAPGLGLAIEQVRQHSVACAHIARLASQRSGTPSDAAFTIGLLHEIGSVGAIIALGTGALWPKPPPLAKVWPVLVQARSQLTSFIAKTWKLPADLTQLLVAASGTHASLDPGVMALSVANHIASDLGLGLPSHPDDPDRYEMARDYLGLRFSDLASITSDAKRLLPKIEP